MEEPLKEQETFQNQIILLNRKQKKKMIVKIIIVLLLFTIFGVYMLCPLSQVRNSKVKGNLNISKKQILEIAHLDYKDSLYFVDEKKCESLLNNHPLIDSSKVKTSILGLSIEVDELTPLLNHKGDYYLNNGAVLDENLLSSPLVGDFLNEIITSIPKDLTSDLSLLNKDNLSSLTSVYFLLDDLEKESIEYFRFLGKNEFSFFYSFNHNYKFEVDLIFPENKIIPEDIAFGIDSSFLNEYIQVINAYKDSFTLLKFMENDELLFEYYSIKVKMKYEFGTDQVKYDVYRNNEQIEEL